ncbi:uncharacterized protein METZ01_LOCUS16346 [marine metagenome]|uniref:Uncharacterized protein n=1 Tax=marine metagenome TaxID=408172 RepID=A0A381P960_9ZZZZ
MLSCDRSISIGPPVGESYSLPGPHAVTTTMMPKMTAAAEIL